MGPGFAARTPLALLLHTAFHCLILPHAAFHCLILRLVGPLVHAGDAVVPAEAVVVQERPEDAYS